MAHFNGASVAAVQLAFVAVAPARADELADEANDTDVNLSVDEINGDKGVEWPDPSDGVFVVENTDEDATDEEIAALEEISKGGEGATVEPESGEVDADDPDRAPYEVLAMFANPRMALDYESLAIDGETVTVRVAAIDFSFPGFLTADAFSLVDAEGAAKEDIKVGGVRLLSSSEAELSVKLPNAGEIDALDRAWLVLAGAANESEADVECLVEIPAPWLALALDYQDEAAGTATFAAVLGGTSDELAAEDLVVEIDGNTASEAQVKANDDGTCSVTVSTKDLPEGADVTVEASNVEDYAGTPAKPVAAGASVEAENDARFDVGEIAKDAGIGIGKAALSAVASAGWQKVCESVIDPAFGTSLTETTNADLMSKLVDVEGQLTGLQDQVSALFDAVEAGQNEAVVNNAESLISEVYNLEWMLRGKMNNVYALPTAEEREAALKALYADTKTSIQIDQLAQKLGVLHDTMIKASSRTKKDLIAVYDEMCALSCNWGVQAYADRQQFREKLAVVWACGASMVDLVYGAAASDEQADNLARFDKMTADVNTLVNTTHAINPSCCWINDDEEMVRDQMYFDPLLEFGVGMNSEHPSKLYCYTTGKWYESMTGDRSATGWNDPFAKSYGNRKNGGHRASTPFMTHETKLDKHGNDNDFDYRTNAFKTTAATYATTAEIKALLPRLRDGQTLGGELESVGFQTAKYLITSEQLNANLRVGYHLNDWVMDTFDVTVATANANGFTAAQKHFDGFVRNGKSKNDKYHTNWHTAEREMFVLKYADASTE